ncbi:iron chaperone [Candidatus Nitrosotenuis chungbukensis]|uniref:iron chaperone n=1 Tax=Candidatus Nitrosotenuis chungbukensis TaxID=1353246 RepID=UPI0005B284E0|nr:DUF1801 domain-containing protein [Candidatus Nitrosotenuis chungbukensis]
MTKIKTVDDYLAAVPDDARAALAKIRSAIKAAAPKATETISYRIPMYKDHGSLVGFGAFRDHCSFFVASPSVMRSHSAELKGYKLGKATINFPADKPLPAALVKKLVKARIAENEARR